MHRRSTAARRVATLLASALGLGLLGLAGPATTATAAAADPRPIVTGWGYFKTVDAASTQAAIANADLVPEVSPFWYTATRDSAGSHIEAAAPCAGCSPYSSGKASVVPALRAAGVKVLPTITDGMATLEMASVLGNATRRASLVSRIVSTVTTNDYDGIDLDFEGFAFNGSSERAAWASTRVSWVAFVKELSAALHAEGKLLSVTTPPIYNSNRDATSGYWVYDWAGIASAVDRLRIMAYDYSVLGGNIAPYPWVESVVQHAVTQVPSTKVQIGVAAYGRNAYKGVTGTCPTPMPSGWNSGVPLSFTAASAYSRLPLSGPTTDSLTDAGRTTTISRTKAVRVWDPTDLEYSFTYSITYSGTTTKGVATSCTAKRAGWYDESRAALARAQLVGTYKLRGIAQWNLDGASSAQWSGLRTYATSIAPVPTAVTAYVPSATTFGATTTVVGRATAGGAAVQGARAVLYARPAGSSTWQSVASGTTSSTGRAFFDVTVTRAMEYKVSVPGTWDRISGWGTDATALRTLVSLTQSATTVKAGKPVTVKVALRPWRAGQVVSRQVYSSGRWVTVATATADKYGKASFTFAPAKKGTTYKYRIYAAPIGAVQGAYASFTVAVT